MTAADASDRPQDEAWDDGDDESCFVKLLDGKEDMEWVRMRASLFRRQWHKIERRVKVNPSCFGLGNARFGRVIADALIANLEGCQ